MRKIIEMQDKAYNEYASCQLWKAIFEDNLEGIKHWSKEYFGGDHDTLFNKLMEMIEEGYHDTLEYKKLYNIYNQNRR